MNTADYRASGRIAIIAITTVCAMQFGCDRHVTDLSTPRTAYEAFRTCVGNGDWEGVFPLLIPEVKDNITKTWTMNRKTAQLIETGVPAALKQNFLAEIGPAEVREATSPQAYFAAVMRAAYPASLIPGDSRYSVETSIMKISETKRGSRNYIVTTTSGKTINVNLGPDNTYGIEPTDEQARMFRMNYKTASELYINVNSVVESLGRESWKAPR